MRYYNMILNTTSDKIKEGATIAQTFHRLKVFIHTGFQVAGKQKRLRLKNRRNLFFLCIESLHAEKKTVFSI